jgi:peptide/nickel transport system permease protein
LGTVGLVLLVGFVLVAIFAPFLASSLPICIVYDGKIYFPLFRYLLSSSFFTKAVDLFFNTVSLFILPFMITFVASANVRKWLQGAILALFLSVFVFFGFFQVLDPANSAHLNLMRQEAFLELTEKYDLQEGVEDKDLITLPSWYFDLEFMNDYARLKLLISEKNERRQHARIVARVADVETAPYTLHEIQRQQEEENIKSLKAQIERYPEDQELKNRLQFIFDKRAWIEENLTKITFYVMPLVRSFHWEDDAGGEQKLNNMLPFFEKTRTTRKDLVAALIFGSRISLSVGFLATFLALVIGIPLGLISGFYGAKIDMVLSRFVEVWEAMPAFFMLLLIVTILQTKSIFLIISVIAIFGWTMNFRFVRAETFRERELPYIDASKALGFRDSHILYRHILPNALLAVLALLPFEIMSAITREAGLAFLGLGEEQSCSWGVLMDEGRAAFPAESGLLWPPAIVLTLLLISIAFVGQAVQWAMNPKSS